MYYVLKNEKTRAIAQLQKAIELGYTDIEWLKTNNSLDSIRKEKVFLRILTLLEKDK